MSSHSMKRMTKERLEYLRQFVIPDKNSNRKKDAFNDRYVQNQEKIGFITELVWRNGRVNKVYFI
jgi:hypothetical protein